MTDDLDNIRLRINAAEAYTADAERALDGTDAPLIRLAIGSTLASVATAQLLHLIATRADTKTNPRPCTEQATLTLAPGHTVTAACILDAGHGGAHQDGPGRTWHRIATDTEPDRARCSAERDGSRCVRNTGHPDAHFGAGAEWQDECGDPFPWDPDYTCTLTPDHDDQHAAPGYRWGSEYCAAEDPQDTSRRCLLAPGHTGWHTANNVGWPGDTVTPPHVTTDTGGDVTPDTEDVTVTRRPITGRIRYMTQRLESMIDSISEGRLSLGDIGILSGIVLGSIAEDINALQIRHPECGHFRPSGSAYRCTRPSGHTGPHGNSDWTWAQDDDDRPGCSAQDPHRTASWTCELGDGHKGPHVDGEFHRWDNPGTAAPGTTGMPGDAPCDRMSSCCRQKGHKGECLYPWSPCGMYATRAQGSHGPCVRDTIHEDGPHRDATGAEW